MRNGHYSIVGNVRWPNYEGSLPIFAERVHFFRYLGFSNLLENTARLFMLNGQIFWIAY